MTEEATDAPMPVMVSVRPSDGKVSVRLLVETPVGLALYDGDTYIDIGQVRFTSRFEHNPRTHTRTEKKGWTWWYDERGYGREMGHATSQKAAVAAVLKAGNYVEAPENAANQGLWD